MQHSHFQQASEIFVYYLKRNLKSPDNISSPSFKRQKPQPSPPKLLALITLFLLKIFCDSFSDDKYKLTEWKQGNHESAPVSSGKRNHVHPTNLRS